VLKTSGALIATDILAMVSKVEYNRITKKAVAGSDRVKTPMGHTRVIQEGQRATNVDLFIHCSTLFDSAINQQ
jgi:hypothetical protein